MIITALNAENFRKYSHLQLSELPARGIIAVVGGNESGKSSLGDAILFGLFGRTAQVKEEEATKLIRWGAEQANITLRLQHRGHEYRLVRSINKAGQNAATLFSTEEETTLADTPEGVEQQLKSLLGYQYGAFSRAFYWGQQSNQNAQGDSDNLRAIAGLKEHAQLCEQLEHENTERGQTIDTLHAQYKKTRQAADALQIDPTHLPKLESIGTELEDRQQHFLQMGQLIDKETEKYPANMERFQRVQQENLKIGRWTKWALLVFLLTLLAGLFLMFAPNLHVNTGLSDPLRDVLGQNAIRVASVAALISAVLLVYGWYVDMRKVRPLQQQANQLVATLQKGYDACTQPVSRVLKPGTVDYLVEKNQEFPANSTDHADMASIPEWLKAAQNYDSKSLYILSAADTLNNGLTNRNHELGEYLNILRADIGVEQEYLQHRKDLYTQLTADEEQLEHLRREKVVFATAIELLQRDASYSIERFNQLVKRRCPELLKRFTQAHYKALEITPDFNLKVLSEEKGDYLDFNEISAGTQRQISLAMRLALANALADATKTDKQLLFMDEPFAFFDPERTNNTLHSLEETSQGSISQIWLTAQTQPLGIHLARVIECPQGVAELKA
jgi:exonuclease SbcC